MCLLIVFLCYLIIYLNAKNYGIGISPDSTHYISTADNISSRLYYSSSITSWDVKEETAWPTLWPPLFPIFLSIFIKLRIFVGENLFVYLNSSLWAITVILSWMLLVKLFENLWERILTIFLLNISIGLNYIYLFVWSETLFIPFILVYILLFDKYRQERSNKYLVLLLLVTSLLPLIKYIGIIFILPILYFFIQWKIKLWKIVLFIVSITIPLIIVLLLNYFYTGTITGMRLQSQTSFFDNSKQLFKTIYDCYLLGNFPFFIKEIFIILFVSIFTVGLIKQFRIMNSTFRLLILICVAYLILLILLSTFFWIDQISVRFLSPIFILITILFVKSIAIFKNKTYLTWCMVFLCLIGTMKSISMTKNSLNNGIGEFSTKEWRSSEIIRFLREQKYANVIYSNFPDAINYFVNTKTKLITDNPNKVAMMMNKIYKEKAILVILSKTTYRNVVHQNVLEQYIHDSANYVFLDGKIYFMKN